MQARTYDLTNLETKANTKRYMRWHTTFSHNVTNVLSENVVSVSAENSFQPTHSMIMQKQEFKTIHPTYTDTRPCIWRVTTHIIALMTASPLRTEIPNMWYCSQNTPKHCVHDTAPNNTPLDRQCIRSCSQSSHLPWRRGKMDPCITIQMNGTHTITRRMSDEIEIWCINPQVST